MSIGIIQMVAMFGGHGAQAAFSYGSFSQEDQQGNGSVSFNNPPVREITENSELLNSAEVILF